ncbi:MAG: pitrilysin family protein [Desulfobacterales bacterium]|jgi:predicted Zn-dependent peptidase
MRFLKQLFVGSCLLLFVASSSLAGNSFSDIQITVKEFQLENGMLFLVVERPTTPQVACRLAIRAGSALEDVGKTGIAHMLEHMMFKGTKNFGTRDVEKDLALQEKIDSAYQAVGREQQKRHPNKEFIRKKLEEMERLRAEVQKIYVPQAFSTQLARNGAVGVNAFTTKDQTQYIMSMPSDMLEQWFSIVSEQIFEPSWREFYVEKDVVQREWAFRYVNSPAGAAWLDLETTAYTAHPYRNPIIGWKSDMQRYTTADAVAFHQKYYSPSNAVCVLVGDVKLEDVRRLAEIYFERYPAGRRSPETVTAEPQQQGPRKSVRFLKGARTPLVRIGFHGARMGTKDFYALDAMTMVLSHGRSARLTQNIVDKGLAVQAWAYNPDNRYGGMIILGASPNEPQALQSQSITEAEKQQAYLAACEKVGDMLVAEIEKLKTELVSARELERIKKLNQRDFLERMRSNEDLAGSLATLEVQVGWQYFTEYLDRMGEISPDDIREVTRKYMRTGNQTRVYVIPGKTPHLPPETYTEVRSISGASSSNIFEPEKLENNSIYPTPVGWKHPLSFRRHPQKITYPRPQTAEIKNATVFYLPDRELPLIDLTLLIKAGETDLPDGKTGLSGLLESSLIRGGTQNYSPSELAMALDENAIQLSVSVGEEDSAIHLSVIKHDWDKGLALLQEVITQPAFDAGVLTVAKDQELVALRRQSDRAQAIAMREGMIWHFKGHPYGRDPLLGLDTIPAISREDLQGFIKKYFIPANMVAAVAGDIDKQRAVAGLKKLFNSLPKGKSTQRNLSDPPKPSPVLALIHKPGQLQSQVVFLLRSNQRTHPDYWKTNLLANIFGGDDSLMYKRLRDDLGLVYSAGFFQTYKWRAGILIGYIGCKGDQTKTAITETLDIMKDLRREIPPENLKLKRLDALNSFVFNVDTPAELVEVYGRYHLRNEPLDTLERIQDAYLRASREDLLKIAARLLDPRKIQIFVVGDKKITVKEAGGQKMTLEEDSRRLARRLGLPYKEIKLR